MTMDFKNNSGFLAMLILSCIIIISCDIKPEPIQYGHDECSFCKMTIVDKAHAAQLVTKKGKQFKYDAIECLVWNVNEVPGLAEESILLVADYLSPGTMLPAEQAGYIVSPRIKSPMGANLSAVANEQKVDSLIISYGGDKFNWSQLLAFLSE
jgi:copper chaperone NosL